MRLISYLFSVGCILILVTCRTIGSSKSPKYNYSQIMDGEYTFYDTIMISIIDNNGSHINKRIEREKNVPYYITGYYKNNKRVGEWKMFFKDTLSRKIIYSNNERIISIEHFHWGSNIVSKKVYDFSIYTDSFCVSQYDKKGNEISRVNFPNAEIISAGFSPLF